jgi:DNA (cytosine-5)-methyltransferase 1
MRQACRGDGMRPRLLDLFCGAGGAAMGYHRAGFDVVGVDINPQPRYPFAFVQTDALEYVAAHGHEFDAIHASPPCQEYSALRALTPDKHYPDLVAPTRDALERTGKPYVIENVMSAPLTHGITLCGGMFGLRTYRHRRFESSVLMFQPHHPRHVAKTSTKKRRSCWEAGMHISVTGDIGSTIGGLAMGIDWMTGNELSQAIPPAYTEYIGARLIAALRQEAA